MKRFYYPLGKLSDWVVAGLPDAIAENNLPMLVATIEMLVDGLSWSQIALAKMVNRRLARLDAKMLETTLVHLGQQIPDTVTKLVDELSGSELPALLYEEIILANPEKALRTFTHGKTGGTEALFYMSHQKIEAALEQVIRQVSTAMDYLSGQRYLTVGLETGFMMQIDYLEEARNVLENLEASMNTLPNLTHGLANMPREHFAEFRRFLNANPRRGTKGPSGAFTARVPLLEILVRPRLPKNYLEYLQTNVAYLPKDGRRVIRQAIERRKTSLSFFELAERSRDTLILDCAHYICSSLDTFRQQHYRAVARQIPEALSGTVTGTAGENPGAFLRGRIESLQRK